MGLPKKKSEGYLSLYQPSKDTSSDKRTIGDLRHKITELIESDPQMARKAALILEHWLRQKSK